MRSAGIGLVVFGSILGLVSCGDGGAAKQPPTTPTASTATTASTPPPPPITWGKGIDTSTLDTSTAPCDDFYQYACGGWIKATEIPSDESGWYRSFSVIRDKNEEILRQILEAYAKGENKNDPYAKQLGDFYGSCIDEAGIEKAGTKPIKPWLDAIEAVRDPASLTRTIGKMSSDGIGVLVDLSAMQDFGDATKVVGGVSQGGLGMPEREYYLDANPKMTELRQKYEEHVARMMALGGESPDKAKASAKKVVEIETLIAQAWMTKEDRREPKKINHPASRADLGKIAPGFAWDAFLDGASAKNVGQFNVAQPEFMTAVGGMLGGKVALADWKTYLRWHLYRTVGNELGQKFVEEKFSWRKTLTGAQKIPPRWKRCVRAVDASMGEALAQPFVKKTLGAQGKANVLDLVKGIEAAMHKNLEGLAWMDDGTRKAAFVKLGKVANKIAYPDKWRSYEGLTIDRTSYVGNAIRASAFETKRQLAKIGKPVDKTEWQMSPPTVNAYYDAQLNEMVFPAGILQTPFYSLDVPAPLNFGGIGMVMGHELTHGFDDEGRQFDADGNLKDWWGAKVNGEFEHRAECVQKQFDGYTVLGDAHVNGKLTLGENIADLGGVKLAFHAMKAAGNTDENAAREFFLGFAQGWCGKMRDEALRHLVATNPHSPPNYRVNGPLSNTPEFAKAFGCGPTSKMVSKDRCEVW